MSGHIRSIVPQRGGVSPIDNNTVFYAPFDEDSKDILKGIRPIGNKNSLSCANNAYVSIPYSAELDLTNTVTLEAWLKYTATGNVVVMEKSSSNTHYQFQILEINQGTPGPGGRMAFMTSPSGFPGTSASVTPLSYADGMWHLFVGTYNRSETTSKIYVDGVLVATNTTHTSAPSSNTLPFNIGSRNGASGFGGSVDSVRIWSRVLSDSEVINAMNGNLKEHSSGIVGCWMLNEGEGVLARDYSAVGNDGLLIGGAVWTEGRAIYSLDKGIKERGVLVEEGTTNIIPGGAKNMHPSIGNGHGTFNTNQYNNGTYFSIGTITDVTNNIATYVPARGLRTYDVVKPQTTGGGLTAGTNYFIKAISPTQFTIHQYNGSQDGSQGFRVHDSIKNDIRIPINATDFPTMWHGDPHLPNSGLVKEVITNGFSYEGRIHDCLRLYTNYRTDGVADFMAYGVNPIITAGIQYTISFYYRAVAPETVGTAGGFSMHNGTYFGGGSFIFSSEWKRYEAVVTSTSTGSASLYWDCGFGKVWDISEIQCEEKAHATSFTEGTRAISNLRYPSSVISGNTQGTVSFWYKPLYIGTNYEVLMRCGQWGPGANGWGIVKQTGGTYPYFEIGIPGTVSATAVASSAPLEVNKWYFLAAVWGVSETALYVYGENGLIQKATAGGFSTPLNYQKPIGVGKNPYDENLQSNAIFDEIRLDKIARTSEEIQAMYYQGRSGW